MIRLIWLKNLRNSYNSNKNLKRRNQIILPKIIWLLLYFQNEEFIHLFYLFPQSILALKI